MLNDGGNENGKKYQLFLLAKKSFTSAARFFVHFFDVVLQHDNVRRPMQLHILYRKCRMCSPQFLLLVSLVAFFFSLPLIVTSLAARISYFVTVNFHVFLPTKFVSFVLYLTLYLFPCYPRQ